MADKQPETSAFLRWAEQEAAQVPASVRWRAIARLKAAQTLSMAARTTKGYARLIDRLRAR